MAFIAFVSHKGKVKITYTVVEINDSYKLYYRWWGILAFTWAVAFKFCTLVVKFAPKFTSNYTQDIREVSYNVRKVYTFLQKNRFIILVSLPPCPEWFARKFEHFAPTGWNICNSIQIFCTSVQISTYSCQNFTAITLGWFARSFKQFVPSY